MAEAGWGPGSSRHSALSLADEGEKSSLFHRHDSRGTNDAVTLKRTQFRGSNRGRRLDPRITASED